MTRTGAQFAIYIAAAVSLGASASLFAQVPPGSRAIPRLDFSRIVAEGGALDRNDRRLRAIDRCFEFQTGVRLRSNDRRLQSLRWFDGSSSSGLLRNGQALVLWPSLFARPLPEVRIAETADRAGQEMSWVGPGTAPAVHPEVPGYRYVNSAQLLQGENIGLWRSRTTGGSLIAAFGPRSTSAFHLAEIALPLDSLFISSPLHGSWGVTLTGTSARNGVVHILHYRWRPLQFRQKPEVCAP